MDVRFTGTHRSMWRRVDNIDNFLLNGWEMQESDATPISIETMGKQFGVVIVLRHYRKRDMHARFAQAIPYF